MTLTEFLLARIAEDEAEAQKVSRPVRDGSLLGVLSLQVGAHDDPGSHDGPAVAIVVSPSRVLAECAAKRAIVGLHEEDHKWCGAEIIMEPGAPCDTLLALAAVYADHPDFREERRS